MCIQGIMVCVILAGCVRSMELENNGCLVLGGLYDNGMGGLLSVQTVLVQVGWFELTVNDVFNLDII
jgi:hypothetical protein